MNDYTVKIKIASNRIRCAECNSSSEDMLCVLEESMCLKPSIYSKKKPNKTIVLKAKGFSFNKTQELYFIKVLKFICTRCGTTRSIGIAHV
jgi:hypothetical protein